MEGFSDDRSKALEASAGKRLDSWKEIAAYLRRDIRSVQRWEKEGLPVRRLLHKQSATIYAYRSEIDDWLESRSSGLEKNGLRPRLASLWQDKKTIGGIGLGAGLLLLIGPLGWILPDLFSQDRSASQPLTKLSITLPETTGAAEQRTIGLAISPDGRRIVYVGKNGNSTQLYLRPLDEAEAQPIPGTEGAAGFPFFSPDGRSLGFFTDGKLKRVSFNGGPQITLCTGRGWEGGSWNAQDTIVFGARPKPRSGASLYRVSALGGEPESLATPDEKGTYCCPKFLPGGKALFFNARADNRQQIRVLSLETGEQKVIVDDGSNAYYAPTGHLVYQRRRALLALRFALLAARFDLARLEVIGKAVPVLESIRSVDYALSVDGTLVYVPDGGPAQNTLVWVDREGTEQLVTEDKQDYVQARTSPDGKQIAVTVAEDRELQVWVYDLESDSFRRLTDKGTSNFWPLWTPDGQWITFASNSKKDDPYHLYRKRADGSPGVEHLATRQFLSAPRSWSPDGNILALMERPAGNWNISILLKEDGATPRPFLSSPENEWSPQFSPNGRWIAYFSDETGSKSLYVRAYPEADVTWLVLGGAGGSSAWSPDGSELFYYVNYKMTAVSVQMEPKLKASKPRVLFEGLYLPGLDISPDGQRFLMIKMETEPSPIHVVLNWFEELERLVPGATG